MPNNNDQALLNLCQNIKTLRKTHALSKAEMARIMGIGTKQLTRIEQLDCPKRLGASTLINLSQHFHCTISNLFSPICRERS